MAGADLGNSGCFPLDEKCQFWFAEILITNGTTFFRISRKEDNLRRYTEIFGNFLPEISVPFDFPPELFGWIVCFSEIQQFPDFLETVKGNCPYHFVPVLNFFEIFGSMESALCNRGLQQLTQVERGYSLLSRKLLSLGYLRFLNLA